MCQIENLKDGNKTVKYLSKIRSNSKFPFIAQVTGFSFILVSLFQVIFIKKQKQRIIFSFRTFSFSGIHTHTIQNNQIETIGKLLVKTNSHLVF